jgi:hypothetical protein
MFKKTDSGANHLNVILKDCQLPEDDDERRKVAEDVEKAVQSVLDQYGIDARDPEIIDGHTFTKVDDRCPICKEELELIEFEAGSGSRGHASANCPGCDWNGRAEYRLIDLHNPDVAHQPLFGEETSGVRIHDLRLLYVPY